MPGLGDRTVVMVDAALGDTQARPVSEWRI